MTLPNKRSTDNPVQRWQEMAAVYERITAAMVRNGVVERRDNADGTTTYTFRPRDEWRADATKS